MSERPEERLVRTIEAANAYPAKGPYEPVMSSGDVAILLPIARAMAEVVKALRKVADEAPMDSWVAIEASAALYALDSLGEEA